MYYKDLYNYFVSMGFIGIFGIIVRVDVENLMFFFMREGIIMFC